MKPKKDPLGVSGPSKLNQGTTRGKENILLTSVGIEPTTSAINLPLLCRLSYEVGQRKSGTIKVVNRCEEKVRVRMNVVPRSTMNTNGGTENFKTLKCELKCYVGFTFSVPPIIG